MNKTNIYLPREFLNEKKEDIRICRAGKSMFS